MKKNIYLLGLLLTMTISGCGNNVSTSTKQESTPNKVSSSVVDNSSSDHSNSSSSVNVNTSTSEENSTSSSIKENNEAEIVIEYYYKNGEYIDRMKTKGTIGENYSYDSPKIDFMKADDEVVKFTLSNEGFYQKVIYDYSYEVVENVEHGMEFSSFMVDPTTGVSLSFISSNNDIYRNNIFENDYFVIMNSYLKAQDQDYYAEYKPFSAIRSNNATTDEFLVGENNEIFVSISINPDQSIDMYKDGLLMYTWFSSMKAESGSDTNKLIRDLVDNIFFGLSSSGFKVSEGNFNIKNLMVREALTIQDANKLYSDYVHTKIRYVDEFGNSIFEDKSIIDNGGTEYNYTSPSKEHYTYDKSEVSGVTDSSKVENVVYTFEAEERITSSMIANKENVLDRKDTYQWAEKEWYNLALELEGDFILRTNYHLKGAASKYAANGGDSCWRTNLTVIEDSSNKDRFVSRLDWYGWMDDVNKDGTQIGKNTNFGSSYLDNYNQDTYNVYSDCDITETITREGNNVTIDCIICPNKKGYENKVYNYRVTFTIINSPKVNVKFAAEDAVITFNSIKYKEI